jgi:hypothetical protein
MEKEIKDIVEKYYFEKEGEMEKALLIWHLEKELMTYKVFVVELKDNFDLLDSCINKISQIESQLKELKS